MKPALLASMVLGVATACGSTGTGGGTIGVPPVGQYEKPPPTSDPPTGGPESPGTSGDPTGNAACLPCGGYLSCDSRGTEGTSRLDPVQNGNGCSIDGQGFGGLVILACGGTVLAQECTGGPTGGCTEQQVGTWSSAGGTLTLCVDAGTGTSCITCTPTDAPPMYFPGGGQTYDAGSTRGFAGGGE